MRAKVDPLVARSRSMPARVFRLYPDTSKPFLVEVRIARNVRRMREECRRLGHRDHGPKCEGMVASRGSKRPWCSRHYARGTVARMFLNLKSLRARPSEIVAHECAHAAMAWVRSRRADLSHMPGEEVLAYAVGELVRQLNAACYSYRVWS